MENAVISRLMKWVKGGDAPPHKILLYPTNKCNLKCPFCFLRTDPYKDRPDMPSKCWLELTKELCNMGIDVFQISGGGEPMMRAQLTLQMMKIIKSYGKTGRLVTNGTIWKDKWIKQVVEIGWDHVIFSVDGADRHTQDASRGMKGTFQKNVKFIRCFYRWKNKLGSEKPQLEFSTVLTYLNYRQIDKLINLAHKLNVVNITIEPVFITNPNVEKLKLSKNQRKFFMQQIDKLKILADSLGISTNLNSLKEIESIERAGSLREKILEIEKVDNPFLNLPCFEPWLWPKIEAHGEVGPCSSLFLTNIHGKEITVRKKSFRKLWYGEEFNYFRNMLLQGKLPLECANCVSTHIPTNKKIREILRNLLKHNQLSKVASS